MTCLNRPHCARRQCSSMYAFEQYDQLSNYYRSRMYPSLRTSNVNSIQQAFFNATYSTRQEHTCRYGCCCIVVVIYGDAPYKCTSKRSLKSALPVYSWKVSLCVDPSSHNASLCSQLYISHLPLTSGHGFNVADGNPCKLILLKGKDFYRLKAHEVCAALGS